MKKKKKMPVDGSEGRKVAIELLIIKDRCQI